ncbi:MAG: phage tail protein [Pseudomonadota bacterium]|nr:phage tail protein [Pseudomonadota bacterium]
MSQYLTVLTDTGAAAHARSAANNTPMLLAAIAVGDGGGDDVAVSSDRTTLVRETYRGDLSALYQDPDNPSWYIAELVIPAHVGGWEIREIGLFDQAGELIGYGNYPTSYKPIYQQGSTKEIVVRMCVEFSPDADVALIIDPNLVTATRQWVLSIAMRDVDVEARIKAAFRRDRPHRYFRNQI